MCTKSKSNFAEIIENESEIDFQKILCLGSGYVGVLSMTVFAHYHPNIQFSIYDKSKNVLDKWNFAGKNLKNINCSDDKRQEIRTTPLPILETKFEQIFKEVYERNLFFKESIQEEVSNSEVIFICVNTPSTVRTKVKTNLSIEEIQKEISQGIELNMSYVYSCVDDICQIILNSNDIKIVFKPRIIVQKSTVTLETLKTLYMKIKDFFLNNREQLNKIISSHNANTDSITKKFKEFNTPDDVECYVNKHFRLINIPEFLAEGSAMNNLINPDRVIIGYLRGENSRLENINNSSHIVKIYSKQAVTLMKSFYLKWIDADRIIDIDSNSSEMIKLVSNAFLAQRISSINSLSQLCEISNGNINNLSEAVGMDQRIGRNYLKASMGFGGSCLKKDVLSLIFILSQKNLHIEANYWMQVLIMNEYQRLRIASLIKISVNSTLAVSIFGLSFKGDVKDVRQSNAVYLISYLIENGINVHLYDELVEENDLLNELKLYAAVSDNVQCIEDIPNIKMFDDHIECVKNCQSLVLCSNHNYLKSMDLVDIAKVMNENCSIFDLYDIFPLEVMQKSKFKIFKLGEFNEI
jgi:UDPglucose 6-dehydrogenase